MRRPRALALALAALVVVAAAYGAYRTVVHGRALLTPAIITPGMDARRAVAPSWATALRRALDERFTPPVTGRPRIVALTFDDGPYAVSTPLLLDALRDLHVPATFFLIGRDAQQFPELAARIARDGNEIANHTYSHPNLDQLSPEAVRNELQAGGEVLAPYGGRAVWTLMRPPHGRYNVRAVAATQAAGFTMVLWNDDPGDWRRVTPADVVAHVAAHARAPEILLLHSGKQGTIDALPRLVAAFRAAGYRFATVSELMREVPLPQIERSERLTLHRSGV